MKFHYQIFLYYKKNYCSILVRVLLDAKIQLEGIMNSVNPYQPFGMIFEEAPTHEPLDFSVSYNEELDMNIVIDNQGMIIPCVEYRNTLGTKTQTSLQKEESDEDEQVMSLGTKTFTKIDAEESDDDESNFYYCLGTKTTTEVEKEETDNDESNFSQLCYAGTKTATKTFGEDCDSDE